MAYKENINLENDYLRDRDIHIRDYTGSNNLNNQNNLYNQYSQNNQYISPSYNNPNFPSNLNNPNNSNMNYPIYSKPQIHPTQRSNYHNANSTENEQQYYPSDNPNLPYDEYEDLKNAYMSQLVNEKNLQQVNNNNNSYRNNNTNANITPIIEISNSYQNRANVAIDPSSNINYNEKYNQVLNPTIISRPMSEKNPDKEMKRQKQERYRSYLDMQLREQNERKDRHRKEKRGDLVTSNNIINQSNQSNQRTEEIIYSPNHKNSNKSPVANSNTNNYSEKELEKKKKIEYQNELLRQIEDRKKRQEEEKRKIKEEEIRYEEKFMGGEQKELQVRRKGRVNNPGPQAQNYITIENQPGYTNTNNTTNNTNTVINKQFEGVNSNNTHTQSQLQSQLQSHTQSHTHVNNLPSKELKNPQGKNNPELTEEYLNFRERQMKVTTNNIPMPMMNAYPSTNTNSYHYANEENYNNNYTLSSPNANNYNSNQYAQHPQHTQYNQYASNDWHENNAPYTTFVSNNNNNNPMSLIGSYNYSNNPSNINNTARTYNNQVIPPFFEEMLKFFFQEQVKVINQYKGTLDKISDERDKAIFQNLASREKQVAINQLKLEQERFKSNLGFYPFDNNYNKNIEDMFNTMIENNFKPGTESNYNNYSNYTPEADVINTKNPKLNQAPINSNNSKNSNNLINKSTAAVNSVVIDDRPISAMKENVYKRLEEEKPLEYLDFRSKYEDKDITQSMLSFKDDEPRLVNCSSKFVCINPKAKPNKVDNSESENENDFLTTWREDADISKITNSENEKKRNYSEHESILERGVEGITIGNNHNQNYQNEQHKETTLINQTLFDEDNYDNYDENANNNLGYYYKQENYNEGSNRAAKSVNIPIKRLNNPNIFLSHREYEKMVISHNDKNKSLIIDNIENSQIENYINNNDINNSDNYNSHSAINKEQTHSATHSVSHSVTHNEIEEVNANYSNDNFYNPDYKLNCSEYSETFNEDLAGIESNGEENEGEEKRDLDLNDYKDIHEINQLQSKVNFFETSEDNYDIKKKSDFKHVIDIDNKNILKPLKPLKPDPKDRLPRDITVNNINKLNDIYDKFNNYKKQSNLDPEESGEFMTSIHNFNNHLQRPFTAFNNLDNLNDYSGVDYKVPYSAKEPIGLMKKKNPINSDKDSYVNMHTDNSDAKSYQYTKENNNKNFSHNPINDLNNEDSLIKDLTKFTKFALNEINQSDMSLFKNRPGYKDHKYNY